MNISNFIQELKRRNVFKVATAYAIAGWLIIQISDIVFPRLGLPDWTVTFVIALVFIGLPISIIVAWAFELTPDGLKTTKEVDEDSSISHNTGSKINKLIIGGLCLLVVFLVVERIFFASSDIIETPSVITNVSDKSIAVLPFDDFNAGGQQEYFADGLTEEILNSLAKTPDLLVASRTSSFQYKNQNIDVIKIADTLGVAHILEGSIRESTDKYRITAQLIRASDGFHLWSETYDRPKTDIIDIQEEIAFEIATALETAMDPEALADMVQSGTNSVEAYNSYLDARSIFLNAGQNVDLNRIQNSFENALKIDPTFAEAYFDYAVFWILQIESAAISQGTLGFSYSELMDLYNENMDLAIRYAKPLDRLKYEGNKATVNLEFRRSIELYSQYLLSRPNDAEVLNEIVKLLVFLGEYETAQDYMIKWEGSALENSVQYSLLVASYFWTINYAEGLPIIDKAIAKFPFDENIAYQSHRLLLWAGETEKARKLLSKLRGNDVPETSIALSKIRQFCAEGDVNSATKIFNGIAIDDGSEWITFKTLSRDEEAFNVLNKLHEEDQLFSLSTWLYYPYFDFTKFPKIEEILIKENHKRGPIIEIPFRCGR